VAQPSRWKPTRDFNADDMIFAIERQWKESNPYFKVTSSNHSYFNDMGMPKLLKSVEKVDDYTVRSRSRSRRRRSCRPRDGIRGRAVEGIRRRDAQGRARRRRSTRSRSAPGRSISTATSRTRSFRYKAFPQFWGGKAKIDDLIFAITPDASVRWAKLQKGECHVMPYPNPADLDTIRKDKNVQVLEQPGLNVGYLAYNVTKKPFDDVRVRKAINMAINKKAIIDAVFLTAGVPATNPIPPTMWSYNNSIKDDSYDPAAAKKLPRRCRSSERIHDRPVGDAGAAARTTQRQADRRADASRLSRRSASPPRSKLRMGRVPEAHADRRAPDGMLGWTGDNGDPDNFLPCCSGCDAAKSRRQQCRQSGATALRGPDQKAKTISGSEGSARRSTRRRR
jgi:dipeptide transport system substrate-binding protein